MQFVYPAFLFGLLAISIPVIIHLFNFRRFKKVVFTNIKFLKEVKQQSQKHKNIKHLLVLIARILAIVSLVFAFAQPYIPINKTKNTSGQKNLSIYIDNSFSMNAVYEKGPLFETAKTKAREIVSAFSDGDRFHLLTNQFGGGFDRFYSKDDFLKKLDEIEIQSGTKSLENILSKQSNFLINNGTKNNYAYIISDFQKSFTGNKTINVNEAIETNLIPLKSNTTNNLLIDSVWFQSPVFQPSQTLNLIVKIKNKGNQNLEGGTVSLKINKIQKSISGFDIAAGESKNVSIGFSVNNTGWQNAELKITDYPITFDDTYFFTFNIHQNVKVLELYNELPNKYLKKIFETEPFFSHITSSINQIDFSSLSNYDLIIISSSDKISSGTIDELKKYLNNGGNIAIFPSDNEGKSGFDDFLSEIGIGKYNELITENTEVTELDYTNELLKNIVQNRNQNLDLPKVKKYYKISQGIIPAIQLIKLRNGNIFLNSYKNGKGQIYQFAVNIDDEWSNFQTNQIFLPVIFRIALYKKSLLPLFYTIRNNNLIIPVSDIKSTGVQYSLKKEKFEIILENIIKNDELFLTENNQVNTSGFYDLRDNKTETILQVLAFNYNRAESETELSTTSDLRNILPSKNTKIFEKTEMPINTLIKQYENGKPLWRIFIYFALLFIAIEIILLRFWKKTTQSEAQVLY
ncbi:MAG: BatA and WFA domain-containing protein [Bacteroidia bacterium]|nr:BatA and WFA domain-containing protein [Bacteroidia bacterium]